MRIKKTSQYIEGGATIETGSNTNGNWIKYSDGTMICYMKKDFTATHLNRQLGSLYSSLEGEFKFTFPQTFISAPVVNITTEGNVSCWIYEGGSSSTTESYPFSFVRPTAITSERTITANCIAIGKWK